MNELDSIRTSLRALEKLLYGINYETHFQFEIVCESTDLQAAGAALEEKYKHVKLQPDKFVPIPFSEFSESIIENFKYKGSSSHGPDFTNSKLEAFENLNAKFWQLIRQKFIVSHTMIYTIPNLQTWVYWDFCFLLVSKDRNKIYLFEGGASD